MKITYDKEIDTLNVILRTSRVAETREIAPEILLDLDKNGNPLYLEIIGASEKIGKRNFGKVIVGKRFLNLPSFA